MENVLRKPYEISIWEDFTLSENKAFYQERRIAIIGSDQMTSPIKANNPLFKENVNGTHTLVFTLYSKYFNEETGQYENNPFLPFMVNERKVKLKYDDKWYDFIIKDIEEDSIEKSFTYTLIDSYINELSKNGFSIELDTDSENNLGTIDELATTILEGTDWKVGHTDILVEKNKEVLYPVKIPLGTSITAIDMSTLSEKEPTQITISSKEDLTGTEVEEVIYVFYTCAMDETIPMQFLYRPDGNYTVDEEGIVNNATNYLLKSGEIKVDTSHIASDLFRGERLVQKEITKYDNITDKFITVYEDKDGNEVYMYEENEYISPTIVTNLVANSINFTNTSGWNAPSPLVLKNTIYPSMYDIETFENTNFVPYMQIKFNQPKSVYNSGIISNVSFLSKGISKGEKFVLKIKYGVNTNEKGKPTIDLNNRLRAKVAKYSMNQNGDYSYDGAGEILNFTTATPINGNDVDSISELDYVYYIVEATQSVSCIELKSTVNPIGLFFMLSTPDTNNYYFIQDVQLFNYKLDADGNMVEIGDTPASCVKKKYFYYYPSLNKKATNADEVIYEYIGNEKAFNLTVKYDKTFEKIRSITAKESNRFNLIQSLCERFECWPRFEIEHNEDGSIKMDENGPKKIISFHEYVGNENYSGFKYGINLKSIRRSLDSEHIVSKIIVKENSNEYATDGFCTIARASQNPTRETYLLNFRYYIQQGLLDGNEVNNDLYLYTEGGKYLGYYIQLNKFNKQYDDYTTELSLIAKEFDNLDASYKAFKIAYDESLATINEEKGYIQNFCGVSYETLMANPTAYSRFLSNEEVESKIQIIQALTLQAKQYETYYKKKELEVQQQQAKYEQILEVQNNIVKQKSELEYKFYQKYARYIQEGSWISEDYMDDNLYYLDAESILNTSAFPEISYTIDVIELSQLEDFKNYKFSIGDKTYIEDTDFFGYVSIDGVKTPYQEEIIVSEITYNLDSPDENKIKVQNYKTQFEDLFQRITATTQSLQYASGGYNKVTNSFNSDGSITQSTLQNSMINNSLIISNATDQSVKWDETGITITNFARPNEIVRLVSGGILITADGGETWSAGITGNGINTAYLTAGQIDASRINIMSGGYPSFRWDGDGISAYKFDIDETTQRPVFFNFNNYVRLDQYGIYGINNDEDFKAESLEDIKQNASFGLTWDGFFLKSDHKNSQYQDNGRIEISTENDFQVIDGNNIERIKIGQLDKANSYGIRISDLSGNSVMESNDEGMLWLRQRMIIGPRPSLYDYRAQIGIIDTTSNDKYGLGDRNPYSLIFSVKDPNKDFADQASVEIFDNGYLTARKAIIYGTIHAEGGSIGGLDIASFTENISGIDVNAINGAVIKETTTGDLAPTDLKFTPIVTGMNLPLMISWSISANGNTWTFLDGIVLGEKEEWDDDGNLVVIQGDGSLERTASQLYPYFSKDGIAYLKATTTQNGKQFETITVLTLLKDAKIEGIEDLEFDLYNIELNYPEVLKFYGTDDTGEVLTFSPNELVLKSYKGNADTDILDNSIIDYEIYLYSQYQNYYNTEEDKWFRLNGQIKEVIYNESTGLYNETGNLIESPFNNYTSFIDNITYKILLGDFYESIRTATTDYFGNTIRDILSDENTTFKIKLVDKNSGEVLTITTAPIVFGTSSDMASFALTAANIQMAVRDAGLIFDAEGLHVVNGGFEIVNKTISEDDEGNTIIVEDNLFSIEDNQLYMKGNGEFTGTINATNGQFTGTVNALDGSLGNLSVNGLIKINDKLYINGIATEEYPYTGIYSSNYLDNEDAGFYISDNGDIIANQISIGEGATIKKYIKLGNSWIINPQWLNNELLKENPKEVVINNNLKQDSFITIKDNSSQDLLNIKQNGIITIGKNSGIKIDGNTQSIQSFDYEDNNLGWKISPEEAEFNNITARGSLKTVTFEYEPNTVQSVGSILLVKPSSTIKSAVLLSETELDITTETEVIIKENDFVKIGHESLEQQVFLASNSIEKNHIIVTISSLSINPSDLIGVPLINMGAINTPSIVINGSNSNIPYPKTSISIFENGITNNNGNYSLNPDTKLVLGQMPSFISEKTYNIFNANSYGLYAENVFLKGALISEGKDKNNNLFYTGMNTKSDVEFSDEDKALFSDSNNIVLWAGAPNEEGKINIQKAKFKVDNLGNLYANSGYFVGTIITDATITASKIRTAEIEGYQYKDSDGNIIDTIAALSIKNADVGIKFEGDNKTIMELNTNGMELNSNLNIGNNFTVRADSSLVVPITLFSKTRENENITVITPNKVGFTNIVNLPTTENEYDTLNYNSYITNNNDGLSIFEKNISVVSFNSENINSKQSIRMGGQMLSFYDEAGDRVKMQTVVDDTGIIGYDLYLS